MLRIIAIFLVITQPLLCLASQKPVYDKEIVEPAQEVLDTETLSKKQQFDERQKYNKIVAEYRDYLGTIDEDLRKEIESYRKNVVEINRQKQILYSKLSQQAQSFLENEQEFKKKLPLEFRKFIRIEQKPNPERENDDKKK